MSVSPGCHGDAGKVSGQCPIEGESPAEGWKWFEVSLILKVEKWWYLEKWDWKHKLVQEVHKGTTLSHKKKNRQYIGKNKHRNPFDLMMFWLFSIFFKIYYVQRIRNVIQ